MKRQNVHYWPLSAGVDDRQSSTAAFFGSVAPASLQKFSSSGNGQEPLGYVRLSARQRRVRIASSLDGEENAPLN